MKIAFTTNVSSDKIVYYGLLKLIVSFKKFHPDIPLIVFTEKEIDAEIASKNYQNINWFYLNPVMCKKVAQEYDLVVHIDADSIVTERLDEIIEGKYDVAIVRNNSDFMKAGKAAAYTLGDQIHPFQYANCGLVASTSKEFWDDWIEKNLLYYNLFNVHENDVINVVLRNPKYKVKLLDPVDKPLYYGTSSIYGTHTHWDSWKDIVVKNDKLYLNDKLIKILHNAGGQDFEKLNLNRMFSPEVAQYLKKLCDVMD